MRKIENFTHFIKEIFKMLPIIGEFFLTTLKKYYRYIIYIKCNNDGLTDRKKLLKNNLVSEFINRHIVKSSLKSEIKTLL